MHTQVCGESGIPSDPFLCKCALQFRPSEPSSPSFKLKSHRLQDRQFKLQVHFYAWFIKNLTDSTVEISSFLRMQSRKCLINVIYTKENMMLTITWMKSIGNLTRLLLVFLDEIRPRYRNPFVSFKYFFLLIYGFDIFIFNLSKFLYLEIYRASLDVVWMVMSLFM